jgi:hypothetical protein
LDALQLLLQGLSHCFEKNAKGKLTDRYMIEPITANSLECMANGAKTCFMAVYGTTLGEALLKDKAALPADFQDAAYCEDFEGRADACARTWLRPHAMDNLL